MNDPNEISKNLNNVVKKRRTQAVHLSQYNDTLLLSPIEVVQLFREVFLWIGNSVANIVKVDRERYGTKFQNESCLLFLKIVTTVEIFQIFDGISKKATRTDNTFREYLGLLPRAHLLP